MLCCLFNVLAMHKATDTPFTAERTQASSDASPVTLISIDKHLLVLLECADCVQLTCKQLLVACSDAFLCANTID